MHEAPTSGLKPFSPGIQPIRWLLPIVGTGTAIAFAVSVATGVAVGARDIKSGNYTSLPRV